MRVATSTRGCGEAHSLRPDAEIVDKRVAAACRDHCGTGQVIIRIEPGVGFAALGRAMQQIVGEGIHARRADVGVALRVKRGIKMPPAFENPPVRSFEAPHVCHYRVIQGARRRPEKVYIFK